MHAHCVDVLDETDGYFLAFGIPDHFQLQFLPSDNRFFNEDLINKTYRESPCGHNTQFFDIVYSTTACAAHGVSGTDYDRVTKLISNLFRLLHIESKLAFWHLDSKPVHCVFECATVFTPLYGIHLNPDDFDSILIKHAGTCEFRRQIKPALAAKIRQQGIRPLLFDDFRHILQVKWLDVCYICHTRIRHNCRRVGIDQHNFIAKFSKGLAGLSTGVIELTGLSNDDGAGANNHYFVNVISFRHTKSSNSSLPFS